MKPALASSLLIMLTTVLTSCTPPNSKSTPRALWMQLPLLPDTEGFAAPFAGATGGALLMAGGANFPDKKPWDGGTKVWYDQVLLLEKPNGTWRWVGRLLRPLAYGVSVTTPAGVLCMGGSDAQQHYTDTFILEWKEGRLNHIPFPPLPKPCANMSGAIAGNIVYLAGGTDSPTATNALKAFWALDLSATHPQWRELEPWPGPARMLAVASAHDGGFYLFSGVNLSGDAENKPVRTYLQDAYRYRPAAGWKRLPDLPRPAVAAPSPAPLSADRMLLLSGDDGSKVGFQPMRSHPGFTRSALAFDLTTGHWSEAGPVPFSRATVPVVEWQGGFVVLSGEARPGVRSPEVWTLQVK